VDIPDELSLGIIVGTLAIGTIASLAVPVTAPAAAPGGPPAE
jgi:hypothetical protein